MVKKAALFAIIPALVFSNTTLDKTFHFPKPEIRDNVVYVPGCRTMLLPFEPGLPSRPVSLLLPRGEVAVSMDVEYGEPIPLEGKHYIVPFRPGGRIDVPPPSEYYSRVSSVYGTDAFYPADIKAPGFFTHYRYGHPILIAGIRPVQYNPVTGEVRYFKTVTVRIKTERERNPLPTVKFNPFIKSQLQLEADNPEVLENLPYSKSNTDDYEYALITTDALKNSWGDFVAFNTRRGLRTRIETIQNINAGSPGTGAEKLKNYLKGEYEKHSIVYVMLGGDDNISASNQVMPDAITHKSYSAAFKDYGVDPISDKDIAADMFYETLNGQELQDFGWELYAGRFPADNDTELKRMITKTIRYSEAPVEGVARKCLIAGEYKWPNINGGSCYGKDQMVLLYGTTNKNGYTTSGFPNTWTIKELYEKDQMWSKTDLINAINGGQNFVFHTGHSNNYFIMKLEMSDVPKLNNSAYYIGYTTGCYPGAWDNRKVAFNASFTTGHYAADCINEEFMCGTDKGSVAFISNTRFGLGDNGKASPDGSDGSTIRFMRYFLNAVFAEKMHHIAVMNAYSKWINKQEILEIDVNAKPYFGQMAYCAYELNLLGDPALSVWTETPQILKADHPATISSGNFSWDTKMPYTWVALLDKEGANILCTQQSGADGKIRISADTNLTNYIHASPTGACKINVKAHNFLPYQGELRIATSGVSDHAMNFAQRHIRISNEKIIYSLPTNEKTTLSIFNSKGALITGAAASKTGVICLKTMSGGMYYLRLRTNELEYTRKFIVTR